jgi:hypothetical protein
MVAVVLGADAGQVAVPSVMVTVAVLPVEVTLIDAGVPAVGWSYANAGDDTTIDAPTTDAVPTPSRLRASRRSIINILRREI